MASCVYICWFSVHISDLEFSTITDAIDPTVTITESLARLFQHTSKNSCDYPDIAQMRNMSVTTKDNAENITILQSRAFSGNDTLLVKALQQAPILQHHFSHRPALICAWIRGNPAV